MGSFLCFNRFFKTAPDLLNLKFNEGLVISQGCLCQAS